MNKLKREIAYDKLLSFLKEYDKSLSNLKVEDVKKKIDCLRTSFRREYKKVEDSKKSGAGCTDIYTPSLWFYEKMMFIKNSETPRSSKSTLDITESEVSLPNTCSLFVCILTPLY